ncbi:hypothetical protein pdam_00025098 [Pocillopora damicornis]|uniref:Uncharacterized protein n=1 Tax=Pocillopora damicornis TaxID=46731 RepID=A0A3M6UTH8_POCDA|nr:hypothetical protein pdam_00025098 [Pocillopora damicornis]
MDVGYTFSCKDNGSVAEMRDNSAYIRHALAINTGMTGQLFYSMVQLQARHQHCPIGAQIELRQRKSDEVTGKTGEADGLGGIPATQPPLTTPL